MTDVLEAPAPTIAPYDRVVSRLTDLGLLARPGVARCPAHDDQFASLVYLAAADGVVLLRCMAGCSTTAVVEALGMSAADLRPTPPQTALERVEAALTAAGWIPHHQASTNSEQPRVWRRGVGGSGRTLCLFVNDESGLVEISDMFGSGAPHLLGLLGLEPADLLLSKESFPNGRLIAAMEAGEALPDTLASMTIARTINAGAAANPVWAEVRKVLAAAMTGDIEMIGTAVGEMTVNAPDLADWAQESWFVASIDDPEPSTTDL